MIIFIKEENRNVTKEVEMSGSFVLCKFDHFKSENRVLIALHTFKNVLHFYIAN